MIAGKRWNEKASFVKGRGTMVLACKCHGGGIVSRTPPLCVNINQYIST